MKYTIKRVARLRDMLIIMKRKGSLLEKPKLKRTKTLVTTAPTRKTTTLKDLKPELKYNDVSFNTDATTTETVVALTTIAAGDTALLRDGNKIICKSLELRIHLTNESLTQANVVRFVVVKSMQANSAAPTWFTGGGLTDVFDASTITARRATLTASRFKIIMDQTIVVNQFGSTGGALSMEYFHKYMKLPDEVTTYFDGTSAVPVTNAYYLMYVGSTASGTTDCDVVGTARLRFVG